MHSCAPFDTMTSRSERQDHFGSDFVVIRAAMPFALLRLRSFEVGCGCSHDHNSPRIAKKSMSSLGSNIASLGLTIFVGFHRRSVHSEPPPRKTTIVLIRRVVGAYLVNRPILAIDRPLEALPSRIPIRVSNSRPAQQTDRAAETTGRTLALCGSNSHLLEGLLGVNMSLLRGLLIPCPCPHHVVCDSQAVVKNVTHQVLCVGISFISFRFIVFYCRGEVVLIDSSCLLDMCSGSC